LLVLHPVGAAKEKSLFLEQFSNKILAFLKTKIGW
jgi:hypothetical protein